MGLSITWLLRIDEPLEPAAVAARLEALRAKVATLPFAAIDGAVEVLDAAAIARGREGTDDLAERYRWADAAIPIVRDAAGRPSVSPADRPAVEVLHEPPHRLVHFGAYPGNGAEPAFFGLARLPTEVVAEGERLRVPDVDERWQSVCSCKTQHAADPRMGGRANFVRCHLAVIAALDAAKSLGFEVDVMDDGRYWKERSTAVLLECLEFYDQVIAGVYGRLKDALGAEGGMVGAPIAARPDFEHLEAKASKAAPDAALDEVVAELIRLTRGRGAP